MYLVRFCFPRAIFQKLSSTIELIMSEVNDDAALRLLDLEIKELQEQTENLKVRINKISVNKHGHTATTTLNKKPKDRCIPMDSQSKNAQLQLDAEKSAQALEISYWSRRRRNNASTQISRNFNEIHLKTLFAFVSPTIKEICKSERQNYPSQMRYNS